MEIILLGVDDGLLPADDGMAWHVKNQIILPLTSQSLSYLIFKIQEENDDTAWSHYLISDQEK